MVTALMVKPGEHPCITQLCDDGEYLEHAVSIGTDMLCSVKAMKIDNNIAILHAQEGAALSLPGNRRVGKRVIPGTFFIVKVIDGYLKSLSDADIVRFTLKYWEPEVFTEEEMIDSWFDDLFCAL